MAVYPEKPVKFIVPGLRRDTDAIVDYGKLCREESGKPLVIVNITGLPGPLGQEGRVPQMVYHPFNPRLYPRRFMLAC
jgi:hypothetical protein